MNSEVPDVGPHMEVAQMKMEMIRFYVICVVHTVMRWEKNPVWATVAWSLNVGLLIVPN